MKLISLDDTTMTLSAIADLAKDDTVILTRDGEPCVAVKNVSGSEWESLALASNPKFIALIEDSRRSYQEQGGIGIDQLRSDLGLVGRRRPTPRSESRPKPKKRERKT
jgi:hypothetical protein